MLPSHDGPASEGERDPRASAGRVVAGKYELVAPIGEGGMGSVWRAQHLELGAPVAVKLVDARLLEGAEVPVDVVLARFLGEARAAAALRSPHVVQILDYGVDGGSPYMVLELLEGETLERRLERQRTLPPTELRRLVTHVARALMRAHEAGLVHRDLKPSNIFLVRDEDEEVAKVLDFGLAKRVCALADPRSDITGRGQVLGTPAYMSPEQAQGKHVDLRADLWALGVIAFECACGRQPFDERAIGALMLQICREPAPVPSTVASVFPGFDEWFARAVEKEPGRRFGSAREMADALRSGLPDADSAATLPQFRPERTGRSRPILVAAAAALVLAAGAWRLGRMATLAGAASTTAPPPSAAPAAPAPVTEHAAACPAQMVMIAGGTFSMGSRDEALAVARPVHKVGLDSFCLDAYEVTAGDYAECIARGGCSAPDPLPDYPNTRGASEAEHARTRAVLAELCTLGKPQLSLHPINCVSWDRADGFCRAAGKRLPTEAEWEYAARGGGVSEAPWGDGASLAGRVNACGTECALWEKRAGLPQSERAYDMDDGWPGTAPVGTFLNGATSAGVHDLIGNVWEWTADWFETYKPGDVMNPKGARVGDRKAIRGGGFNAGDPSWLHPAYRFHQLASARAPAIGFRCARDL